MNNKLLIIVIIILIYGYITPRYIYYLPTYPIFYPDNKTESLITLNYMNTKSIYMTNLFYMTDKTVSNAFVDITPHHNVSDLDNMYKPYTSIVLFLKYVLTSQT